LLQQLKIQNGEREILLTVLRSSRKSVGLEVRSEKEVLVRIPARLSDRELKNMVEKHKEWIFNKTALVQSRRETGNSTCAVPPENLSPEEMEKIKEKIGARVKHYCQVMGVTVGRITIRNQKTRWGSCSAKGNVNFNYQLYYLPEELLDYVVIHELTHRKHMDHSREFWAEVETYCPDYKKRRNRLKSYQLV